MPDLSDDDSGERVVSAIEVQEDLDKLKDKTMEKVREVNNALFALEREVQLFERARDDSWESVSQRLSTLVDDSVSALSSRLTDLEHAVQSRRTTPVTEESATNVETWATIEQALISEIGKVKDEHTQSTSELFDLLERFGEQQKSLEKQLAGLRGFARHVEQFLDQRVSGGATAPSETRRIPLGWRVTERMHFRDMFPELPARLPDHPLIFRFLNHLLYRHHQFLTGTLCRRNPVELAQHTLVQ